MHFAKLTVNGQLIYTPKVVNSQFLDNPRNNGKLKVL